MQAEFGDLLHFFRRCLLPCFAQDGRVDLWGVRADVYCRHVGPSDSPAFLDFGNVLCLVEEDCGWLWISARLADTIHFFMRRGGTEIDGHYERFSSGMLEWSLLSKPRSLCGSVLTLKEQGDDTLAKVAHLPQGGCGDGPLRDAAEDLFQGPP